MESCWLIKSPLTYLLLKNNWKPSPKVTRQTDCISEKKFRNLSRSKNHEILRRKKSLYAP